MINFVDFMKATMKKIQYTAPETDTLEYEEAAMLCESQKGNIEDYTITNFDW